MGTIKYSQAIRDGFEYLLENNQDMCVMGQGLWSPWYVGSSMNDLEHQFGKERVLDTPVSENSTTGMAQIELSINCKTFHNVVIRIIMRD